MTGNYEIFIDEAGAVRVLGDVAARCGAEIHIIKEKGFSAAIALLDSKEKYVRSRAFNRFWEEIGYSAHVRPPIRPMGGHGSGPCDGSVPDHGRPVTATA